MRVNFSRESSRETSSGVTRPSGVTPCRLSNGLGIQCVSGGVAICGWASIIFLRSLVPDLAHPTMKTYGFTPASAPATGLPDLAGLAGRSGESSTHVSAPPATGVGRPERNRVRREDHRPLLRSARHLLQASVSSSP